MLILYSIKRNIKCNAKQSQIGIFRNWNIQGENTNNIKYNYDKLVFATGSTPNKINSKNINGIFYLRTQKDSLEIKDYVKDKNDKS